VAGRLCEGGHLHHSKEDEDHHQGNSLHLSAVARCRLKEVLRLQVNIRRRNEDLVGLLRPKDILSSVTLHRRKVKATRRREALSRRDILNAARHPRVILPKALVVHPPKAISNNVPLRADTLKAILRSAPEVFLKAGTVEEYNG
jgi:hypothetical protein